MADARFLLEDPAAFLRWVAAKRQAGWASLDEVEVAQMFAIAATAALARHDGTERLTLVPALKSGAARFAHAVGLDEVLEGDSEREPTEGDRTVTLTRIQRLGETEAFARKIVRLMIPSRPTSDAADLYWFVLVELLRNVVQHSQDRAGGIVAAQRNDVGPCTQSFLHALLHESVRLAWARKVPMFVVNAAPTVRAQLEFVEGYSLGG